MWYIQRSIADSGNRTCTALHSPMLSLPPLSPLSPLSLPFLSPFSPLFLPVSQEGCGGR